MDEPAGSDERVDGPHRHAVTGFTPARRIVVAFSLGVALMVLVGFLGQRTTTSIAEDAPVVVGNLAELVRQARAVEGPVIVNGLGPDRNVQHALVVWDPVDVGGQRGIDAFGPNGAGGVLASATTGLLLLRLVPPHLVGDTALWCDTSKWFEEPQHGSKFNRMGEWTGGPASRGLPSVPIWIDSRGDVRADASVVIDGRAREDRLLDQEPEGPNCDEL